MTLDETRFPEPQQQPDIDNDVIVIRKSWLITAVVAIIAFMIGGASGYFVFDYAYNKGADDTAALNAQAAAAAGQQGAAIAQPTAPPARIDGVSADDDPFLGPEDAAVTIVEFSDFQCPYCARFRQQTFDAIVDKYGDKVRIVFRDFPLSSIHPDAQKAAEAAECANEQGKFWEMHDAIFMSQAVTGVGLTAVADMAESLDLDMDQFNECVESGKYADEISKDLQDGTSYGVTGTPTFFINGVRLVGAQPIEQFSAIIDQELESN